MITLDHVNIRTQNLPKMTHFYTKILALKVGWRPAFEFPGAWLYAGDQAIVHLVEIQQPEPIGRIEHFAMRRTDDAQVFLQHLDHQQVTYDTRVLEEAGIRQVFVRDPDGNRVELGFLV